jgi:tetratricopeptide (TPR) repeat protein
VAELTIDQALQQGVEAHKAGQVQEADRLYTAILKAQPKHPDANHNMGVLAVGVSKIEQALPFFKTALEANPATAQFWLSYIDALIKLGKLADAKAVLDQARSKGAKGDGFDKLEQRLKEAVQKPMAASKIAAEPQQDQLQSVINLYSQGQLQQALRQAETLVQQFPQSAILFNIQGAALKGLGQLGLSVEAYNKALAIKPDYAEAYYNMGNALKDQGKLEEAIEAYNKALAIKPDYAEAHRHLSILTKYTSDTAQICEVEALLQQDDLGDSDRCNLLYTNAKMQEDLGNLSAAYASYVAGGGLRQKLLKYEFVQDEHLFGRIKRTAPKFKDVALNVASEPIKHTPIFILGMPRSGTTLVEQIVSSHTEVTGAGELSYVSQSGTKLVAGITAPTLETVSAFRERYLTELAKRAEGQAFITDKMPQNFRYIALICAAFPEAKIVHVQRNAEATCWSNFKHYFASKGLGYSYSLDDTVAYYGLYKDLMHFWSQTYDDRIYNLDYDKLTEDQEPETRRLIEYLGLNWEDACLSPQNNKRSVKTASQQQVRKKVYKGSSQAWRKYESFLNGVFDELEA